MSIIENFATLSAQEQRSFAEALLKTINSESIFSSEVNFELTEVEVDDMTGELLIYVSHTDFVSVSRKASWTCDDEDDAKRDPGYEVEYVDSIYEDAKKAFKTLATIIDGYKVTLDIADVDEEETIEVIVDHISHEDSGIGSYEYWGYRGYDSSPYVEVDGTLVKSCDCSLSFFVEPVDEPVDEEPEKIEEN